jgi:hypothetical protein
MKLAKREERDVEVEAVLRIPGEPDAPVVVRLPEWAEQKRRGK